MIQVGKGLRQIEARTEPLTNAVIAATPMLGIDALEVSKELYSFLGDVLNLVMRRKRETLAAGERNNGFEVWRKLCMTYKGGDQYVSLVDESVLFSYPHCNSESNLEEHLNKWLECKLKVGEQKWRSTSEDHADQDPSHCSSQ